MTKYQIPEMNLPRLQDHIDKLSRRAEKLGCPPVTMTVGGYADQPMPGQDGALVRVYEVEVTGNAPVINGWQFISRIEHLPDGNILYTVAGEHPPEWARTADPKCDHCKTNRDRKDTFLVRHESGEVKQVGSTCLADFLGHNDPQGLAAVAESIAMLDEFARECEGYDPDAMTGYEYLIRPDTFLAYVAKSVHERGWTSRGKSFEGFGMSTADHASGLMFKQYKSEEDKLIERDWTEAKAALEWARENFSAEREGLNDYEWNVAQVVKLEAVRGKHLGLLASVVPAYHRELERQAKEAAKVTCNEYVGEVKKRQMWKNLTVEAVIHIESYYGATHLHKMRDPDGHLIVWFASNFEAKIGDVLTGKGTVKDHSEYKGERQTVLTRCNFEIQ